MGFNKFFEINLKISLALGVLGFIFYLAFSPIERKNAENYKYSIYKEDYRIIEEAKYVKDKSKIGLLNMRSIANVGSYGKDLFFLAKINRAWILDTIDGDVVKFRAKMATHDGSTAVVRGYTLLEYVHPQE